ncbi:hypothetical protein QP028_01870 [Corynebacterium suedekumii]|nr:hypothetical protein QP028_01870 [Corynebacterium suedekumii]
MIDARVGLPGLGGQGADRAVPPPDTPTTVGQIGDEGDVDERAVRLDEFGGPQLGEEDGLVDALDRQDMDVQTRRRAGRGDRWERP